MFTVEYEYSKKASKKATLEKIKKNGKIPIIVERYPEIVKKIMKLKTPEFEGDPEAKSDTIVTYIKVSLNLDPTEKDSIYLFINGVIEVNPNLTLRDLYNANQSQDGFLYISYTKDKYAKWIYFQHLYKNVACLGKGAYGEAYRYRNKKDPKIEYAIKKTSKQKMKVTPKLEHYYKGEIETMRMFRGVKSAVQLIAQYEDENYYYMVLELCDGDYEKILEQHKFNPQDIYDTFSKLNEFLKRMNELKIMHRDLKPENILYKRVGEEPLNIYPKIADFGFAKKLSDAGIGGMAGNLMQTQMIGSPLFMAPEVAEKTEDEKAHYDLKCDLWSIGIIMYYFLHRNPPFDVNVATIKQYFDNVKKFFETPGPYNFCAEDADLNDLMNGLICYNPEQRLNYSEYLNHKFFTKIEKQKKNMLIELMRTRSVERFDEKTKKVIDTGRKYDASDYEFYEIYDNTLGKKILVRKFSKNIVEKHKKFFEDELKYSKAFQKNRNTINYIENYSLGDCEFILYEHAEMSSFVAFGKDHEVSQDELKFMNYEIFNNLFRYLGQKSIVFNIITPYSFMVKKNNSNSSLVMVDFGFHRALLSEEEIKRYYLTHDDTSEITKQTNAMNYLFTLLQIHYGGEWSIKLTEEGFESNVERNYEKNDEFYDFVMNLLNPEAKTSWVDFREYDFLKSTTGVGEIDLLSIDDVAKITRTLDMKYGMTFNIFDAKYVDGFMKDYVKEAKAFVKFLCVEIALLKKLFGAEEQSFKKEDELIFISILADNEKVDYSSFSLNLLNPVIKNIKLQAMKTSEDSKIFVKSLEQYLRTATEKYKILCSYSTDDFDCVEKIDETNIKSFVEVFVSEKFYDFYKSLKEQWSIVKEEQKIFELKLTTKILFQLMIQTRILIGDLSMSVASEFSQEASINKLTTILMTQPNYLIISPINLFKGKSDFSKDFKLIDLKTSTLLNIYPGLVD